MSVSLLNAAGERIATLDNDTVVSLSGEVLGLYIRALGVVTDLTGAYLGEIVLENRLMCSENVPANGGLRGQMARVSRVSNVVAFRPGKTVALPGYGDVTRARLGLGAAAKAA